MMVARIGLMILHTSKRMHFIEEQTQTNYSGLKVACIRQNVCTSLRTTPNMTRHALIKPLAYVKTYALH